MASLENTIISLPGNEDHVKLLQGKKEEYAQRLYWHGQKKVVLITRLEQVEETQVDTVLMDALTKDEVPADLKTENDKRNYWILMYKWLLIKEILNCTELATDQVKLVPSTGIRRDAFNFATEQIKQYCDPQRGVAALQNTNRPHQK